jgi:2-keto-4-pentenoate hydratase/2-oxohepta-3-ene-1,7-dioic acid hydratase in catechol pathway
MKIVRFAHATGIRYGRLTDDESIELLDGDLFEGLFPTNEIVPVSPLLAPIVPTCIIAIGLNYRRHALETGARIPERPIMFYKSPTSVIGPNDPIELPRTLRSDKVDYECELAIVIGRTAKNVRRENALDYVLGYTIGNDVSARDWQKEWGGGQWSRGKSFDTFCPLGPTLVTKDEIENPNNLRVSTRISGETRQESNTSDMIFDAATIIEFLSGDTTLLPGTVILTGTPEGVGMAMNPPLYLQSGDIVETEIERIGILRSPVIEAISR